MHVDDFLDRLEPYEAHVDIIVDRRAAEAVEEAERALKQAKKSADGLDQPDVDEAERQLQAAVAAARGLTVRFAFRNIGRNAWQTLKRKHPPTDEERKINPRVTFNGESFPIAAVAASAVEPDGMTVEKVTQIADRLSEGQWAALWGACLDANVGASPVPLSLTSSNETASSAQK